MYTYLSQLDRIQFNLTSTEVLQVKSHRPALSIRATLTYEKEIPFRTHPSLKLPSAQHHRTGDLTNIFQPLEAKFAEEEKITDQAISKVFSKEN